MTTTQRAEQRWTVLQARAQASSRAWDRYRTNLDRKYRSFHYATQTERKKLDRLRQRETKDRDALYAWLSAHSPRDWAMGVPCRWIVWELSYADATTRGALSRIPDPAWGVSDAEAQRFAEPVSLHIDNLTD